MPNLHLGPTCSLANFPVRLVLSQAVAFALTLQGGRIDAQDPRCRFERGNADDNLRDVLSFDFLDGKILVKPNDRSDGERMLRELGGRTHEVLTAVAVATAQGLISRTSRSEVTFRAISAAQAHDYWATGEPHDKAGGYAIQGGAAIFVADLKGSYSGVMGLPLFETAELLEQASVPHWSYPR